MTTTTGSLALELPARGTQEWDTPVNTNFEAIDTAVTSLQTSIVTLDTKIETIDKGFTHLYTCTIDETPITFNNNKPIIFNNNIWILGEPSYYSPDGYTWITVSGQPWGTISGNTRKVQNALVYDNKLWLLGGYVPTVGYLNDIWNSSDGITWTEITSSATWSARGAFCAEVFDNKMWILGGTLSTSPYGSPINEIWYSTNGSTWTQATTPGWSARVYAESTVYDNKLWILGGRNILGTATIYKHDVWYTSDGSTWTQATTPEWIARSNINSVVYDNKIWVIRGLNEFGHIDNEIWTSTDGETWSEITPSPTLPWSTINYYSTAVIFNSAIWILGVSSRAQPTIDHSTLYDIWYSTDGIEWEPSTDRLKTYINEQDALKADISHTHTGTDITSAVAAADTLSTARTITLSGAVNGNTSFDGSADVTIVTTAPAQKNYIINSSFRINQRGSSTYSAASEQYTLDRWVTFGGSAGTEIATSSLTATGTAVLMIGNGNETTLNLEYRIPAQTASILENKACTFSFNRQTANAGTLEIKIRTASSTDTWTSPSTSRTLETYTYSTESPATETITFTPSTAECSHGFSICFTATQTGADTLNLYINQVQLVIGQTAPEYTQKPVEEEWADCLIYYERLTDKIIGTGYIHGGTEYHGLIRYSRKRITASTAITISDASHYQIELSTSTPAIVSPVFSLITKNQCKITTTNSGTGGEAGLLQQTTPGTGYIEVDAELH